MAKVFRFHTGNNNIEDWGNSSVYGKTEIEGIDDPTGATAQQQITSIPSPLARIDLVQTAFHFLAQKENPLDGNTIHHRMVSDALDVGEILFNIDQLSDKINIIPWDKTNELKKLVESDNPKHKLFGETLQLFLEQDKEAYNFGQLKRFYLLEYNYKIIGGTSPATLFFTTANNLDFVKIPFGNDYVFDEHFQPLYKRDGAYQKYLYHLLKAYPQLASSMKNVQDYLARNLALLEKTNNGLYNDINNLKPETFKIEYDTLNTGSENDDVEILGYPLRKRHKANITVTAQNSDFVIRSSKYNGANKPLVLQNNLNKAFRYTTDPWNKDTVVPYYNTETNLGNRTLPGQIIKYPYLTVSDFLEPCLIRTIYATNDKQFFNGNLRMESGETERGYLLPLTPLFFEFFDTEDVQKNMPDGKPMMEMVQRIANSVTVTLRIPINKDGEYISFERVYYPPATESEKKKPELEQNKGAIVEVFFNVVVFPFFKHPAGINPDYRIMVIDRDTDGVKKNNHYQLAFFTNSKKEVLKSIRRDRSIKEKGDSVSSAFYIINENFDQVQLDNSSEKAMIIPLFPPAKTGAGAFSFAIDFGTTNTHIEWKKDGEGKQTYPFEITATDLQYASLVDPSKDYIVVPELLNWIDHELFPFQITQNSPYHFPQRTTLSFKEDLSYQDGNVTHCLSDFNIPFVYERLPLHANTAIKSNLKWSEDAEFKVLVRRYFEALIFLIRNKVLLNGGNLEKTSFVSFFPASMDEGRRITFKDIFTKPDEGVLWKYFPNTISFTYLSESLAPYYFASNTKAISSSDRPVVSIDVGGGTTDVVVYANEQPVFLTSFRFAGHAIFGDGFNGSSSVNGFVQKYFKGIDGNSGYKAISQDVYPLPSLFGEMEDHSSSDIISFLFSLEDNPQLKAKGKKISFFDDLSNDRDLKVLFVLFYGAIIYHVAVCMKTKELAPPKTILASGRGSNTFKIAEGSSGKKGIGSLAEEIFKYVYASEEYLSINIEQEQHPKQLTCRGGLYFKSEELYSTYNRGKLQQEQLNDVGEIMDKLNFVHFGGPQGENRKFSYDDVKHQQILGKVLLEASRCVDLIFDLLENPNKNFASIFRVNDNNLDKVRNIVKANIKEDLNLGIIAKEKEIKGKTSKYLDETLFFYPLTGALNKAAYRITKGI